LPRKYRLTRPRRPIDRPDHPRPTALIWVAAEDEDTDGQVRIEGDPTLILLIQDALFNSYGNRARPMEGDVSPRDLAVALDGKFLRPFEPQEETSPGF
jgi:hypothetical protein